MQTGTLILTKLQPPALGPDILPRPHLIKRLEDGRYHKLTLISAPAGYGKSVLVSLWQNGCDCPVSWLSLDKNDNELRIFLQYFIKAIQNIRPEACQKTASLLNGIQLPPPDVLAASLVNETAALSPSFLLVLDDYHVIHNPNIHHLINTLIEYQSPHMHLVLITRQDPALDIINLRAKDQITEIRLAELRFNETEAQHYLQTKLGESLTPEMVQQLFVRTEGWATGLRLAIMALRNQVDQVQFLETFQGMNQYIMSYLVKEVLSQQSQPVRRFLLQTSIFDRFCAPLCDFLLSVGEPDHTTSREILERLTQENLFLIPLDYQGEWFRYHHLFQDLLRHQLTTAVSETQINQLHVKASTWFAQHGFIEEALDHAFSANEIDRAVQIVAEARYNLMNETEWQRLEYLLRRFPQVVIEKSLELFISDTWLCYHRSQFTKLPAMLTHLQQLIQKVTLTSERKNALQGEISAIQSLLSYFDMDIENTHFQAEQALTQTPTELWIVRVFARMLLAGAQQMAGDLKSAYATLLSNFDEEFIQNDLFKATTLTVSCNVSWIAADLKSIQLQGTQALMLSQGANSPEMQGNAHYHLGTVAYLHNDLAAAEEHFAFVQQRPYVSYGDSFAHSSCGLSLTYQAQGRELEARAVVDAALSFFLFTGNTPLLMLMKAFQAELAYQQGRLNRALQWAIQFDSVPPMSPMYRFYAFHFTLVKIWMAENTLESHQKASDLLIQIKEFLELSHNNIFMIKTHALQAILHHREENEAQALATIEQALVLGLPENIIRLFVDLGQDMYHLLSKLTIREPELASYRGQILTAMAPNDVWSPSQSDELINSPALLEPLTDREMDVLHLLGQRQTDKEIAQALHISPHTVRTHTKNIYTKLDVNNRRQAVARAEELGLVNFN